MNEIPKPPPDQPKAPDGKPPGTPPTADGAGKGQAGYADAGKGQAVHADAARAADTAKFQDAYRASQKASNPEFRVVGDGGRLPFDRDGTLDPRVFPPPARHGGHELQSPAGPRPGNQPADQSKPDGPSEAPRRPASADHLTKQPEQADPRSDKPVQAGRQDHPERQFADALRWGLKADDPVLRKDVNEVAQRYARDAFDPRTGGTATPESLAKRWDMTPEQARAIVRVLEQEGFRPQVEPHVMDGSGRAGTVENVSRQEMADRVSELHHDTTLGGIYAAWRGARGGSAEEMRNAGQAGNVSEGMASISGGRMRADADRKEVRARTDEQAERRTGVDHPDNARVADPRQPGPKTETDRFREAYLASQKPPAPSIFGRGNEIQGRGAEEALRNVLAGEKFYKTFPNFDRAVYTVAGPGAPAAEIGQLKSIDTTLKSYQDRGFYRAIVNAAGELAGPGESIWATRKHEVTIGPSTRRVLDVALPTTPLTSAQEAMLEEAKAAASTMGVRVDVHRLR